MKLLFVLVSAVLAVVKAGVVAPIALQAVATPAIVAAVPVAAHATQYHSQDAIGQYSYGYANELSAKNEVKSADGQTVGAYAYVDAEGKLQNVQYRSDALHGFRVAATNLPVAPSPIEAPALPLPEPVKDTPEVVEAKSKHLEALRNAEEEAKKLADSVSVEVKSAVNAHPAVISASSVVELAPIIANPTFGYSFGINNGGLYTVNSYSLSPQPIITTFGAPGRLIAAPIIPETISESPKELAEVVEAKVKKIEPEESPKEEPQQQAKE